MPQEKFMPKSQVCPLNGILPGLKLAATSKLLGNRKSCSCSHVVALWVCRDLWIIIISNVTEDGGSVPGMHRGTISRGTLRVTSLGSITFDLAWSTSLWGFWIGKMREKKCLWTLDCAEEVAQLLLMWTETDLGNAGTVWTPRDLYWGCTKAFMFCKMLSLAWLLVCNTARETLPHPCLGAWRSWERKWLSTLEIRSFIHNCAAISWRKTDHLTKETFIIRVIQVG